jgi:hypothetical protein
MHEKYLEWGETVYPGMPSNLIDSAGNERVKFNWTLGVDPRIVKSVFYWNDGEKDDSAVVNVTGTQTGLLNMEAILNVKEGTYSFTLVNKDSENHMSLPVTQTVQVYGPKYIAQLVNRRLLSSSFDDGKLILKWSIVENLIIQYSTVRYTDYSNPGNPETKNLRIENAETETTIEGVKKGDTFSVSTSYLPNGGLDVMDALPVEYTIGD